MGWDFKSEWLHGDAGWPLVSTALRQHIFFTYSTSSMTSKMFLYSTTAFNYRFDSRNSISFQLKGKIALALAECMCCQTPSLFHTDSTQHQPALPNASNLRSPLCDTIFPGYIVAEHRERPPNLLIKGNLQSAKTTLNWTVSIKEINLNLLKRKTQRKLLIHIHLFSLSHARESMAHDKGWTMIDFKTKIWNF